MRGLERGGGEQPFSYLNKVDLVECLVTARLLNVQDGDDVLVIEVAKEASSHAAYGGRTSSDRRV